MNSKPEAIKTSSKTSLLVEHSPDHISTSEVQLYTTRYTLGNNGYIMWKCDRCRSQKRGCIFLDGSTSCEVCSRRRAPFQCTYDGVSMGEVAKKGIFFEPFNIEHQNNTTIAKALGQTSREIPNNTDDRNLSRSWRLPKVVLHPNMSKSTDDTSPNLSDTKISKFTNDKHNIHTFNESSPSFYNMPGRVIGGDILNNTTYPTIVGENDNTSNPTEQYAPARFSSAHLHFEDASKQPLSETASYKKRTPSITLHHLICCRAIKNLTSTKDFTARQLCLQLFLNTYASKLPTSVAPPLTPLSSSPSIFADYLYVLCIIQRRDNYDPITKVPVGVDIRWYGLSSIETREILENDVKVAYIHVGYSITNDKIPKVVTKKDAEMHRKMCLVREPGLSLRCRQEGHDGIEWTAFFATFQAERRVLRLDGKRRSGAAIPSS